MGLSINYIAIIVAGVVSMAIGMLWYSPAMFGNQWVKLMGWKKKDMAKAKKDGMTQSMVIGLIASFVTAFVLTLFIGVGVDYAEAASVAFYAWLGFVAPIMLGMVLWDRKPFQLYVINVTYQLVSLVAMSLIIVAL